ncbi:hypothetical protein BGZ65_005736 [Modicella reniformis]|uniref:Adhesin domain-containing protein n=1 Tax=Modicella reniformis TaxID=1440133 RepID=A0A9P6MGA5_9FUNG|nr:hypothetical protein BGZ65_005736 [Modicella reniformis]
MHGKTSKPSVDIAEVERLTFGQQQPYASTPSTPSGGSSGGVNNNRNLHNPHTNGGMGNSAQERNQPPLPPSDAPPAYEEVSSPIRGPQVANVSNSRDENHASDSSTPLLSGHRPPVTPYNTGPASYASSVSSDGDSDETRRLSRFWPFLIVAILILIVGTNDKKEGRHGGFDDEMCRGRIAHRKNVTDILVSSSIRDYSVSVTGMISNIIVEQATTEGSVPGTTQFIIEATASDHDDLDTIYPEVKQDIGSGSLKATVTGGNSGSDEMECLQTVVKIIFSPSSPTVENLRLTVSEGNITVNLLNLSKGTSSTPTTISSLQVKELYTRVVTGHSYILADVPVRARIGGSEGTIRGELVVGKEMSAMMVDGIVTLNLAQRNEKNVMESKVEVRNGKISVGLATPYEGEFKLEVAAGKLELINPSTNRTHLSYVGRNIMRGWSSVRPRGPTPPASELKLLGSNAVVTLSMTRIDLA